MAFNSTASEDWYGLLNQVPESEEAWSERLATLRRWRSDPRFEEYWSVIDQMLTVDFASFQRRAAAMEEVRRLENYDFDARRKQRGYDFQHAHDHLP